MSTGLKTQTPLEKIQRLADELRGAYESLVAGETVAAPAEIRVLVREWNADVLPEIQARIIKCHELVKRGLRDEAVGHALEQPDLFEAVKLLDLERFGRDAYSAWMQASQAAGLVAPSPPQLDKMGDIEASRERLADLKPLLDQWRRMNFQRAPLPNRIKLLREITRREDAERNDVWRDMLGKHESHRLMEIKADLARLRARLGRDGATVAEQAECQAEQFLSELRGDWTTLEPPADLSDQAILLIVESRQRRIDALLDQLIPQLENAHAGLAADRATAKQSLYRLCDEWNQAISDRGAMDPADPRLARIGPIVDYVELLREHGSLLAEVSHRVNERPATLRARVASAEDLGRMMDRIDDSATRLPVEDLEHRRIKDLSDRVADIADDVHREERLRRAFAVSAVVALLIGVSATAWSVYAESQHRATVSMAIAACDAAVKNIEAGNDVATSPDADWSAAVRRDPRAAAALARVKAASKKRDAGREAFAAQIASLRKTLVEVQTAPRSDPLAPWPESFTLATKLLSEIRDRKLAITDEERAKLEQPAATLRTEAKDFIAAADDAFEARVHRLEADLAAVDLVIADDVKRARTKLEEATMELETLRRLATTSACPTAAEGYSGRKLVSESLAALVSPDSKVATKANGLRSRNDVVAGIAARESEADRLLMSEKYAEYADAIRKIADDLGSGAIARDYTSVARDHANWQALAEWRNFLSGMSDPTKLSSEKAKGSLDKLRALGPEVTRLDGFKSSKPWLEPALERAVADTSDKRNELKDAFLERLESQYGEKLDGVMWEKGVLPYPRYYCLLVDRPLPDQVKAVKYVTGIPDEQETWPQKTLQFGTPQFGKEVNAVADSPQKRLALECKKAVEANRTTGAVIDRLAVDVVRAASSPQKPPDGEPTLEPCLHALLLRFLVVAACDASPAVKAALVQSLVDIQDAGADASGASNMLKGVDNNVYGAVLDPEKQDDGAWVHANRAKCTTFISRVAKEIGEAGRIIEAREQEVARQYRGLSHYRCVGRLRRLAAGGWEVSGGDPAMRAGKPLCVAGGVSEEYKMIPCVECDAKGGIPPGSNVSARAGDPVFIEIKTDSKG